MKKKILSTLIVLSLVFASIAITTSITADPEMGPEDAVEVTKKVWDSNSGEWVDSLIVDEGENVRFKITVTYHDWDGPYNETTHEGAGFYIRNVTIVDSLPAGLDYAYNATEDDPYISISSDGKTITWDFTGAFELKDNKSHSLEFDVHVNSHGLHRNFVEVYAVEKCLTEDRYATASAIVATCDFRCIDVEPDGNLEYAYDYNYDPTDGYEEYLDFDDSSDNVLSVDGDDDGKIDHFVDIDDDGIPDRYWDPDDVVLTDIQIIDVDYDGTDEWVYDSDGDGELDKYYDPDDGIIYPYIVFTLTTSVVGNGYVLVDPDGTVFLDGFDVTLNAVADPDSTFYGWSGDLTGNENPVTIQMDSDMDVTAHFTMVPPPPQYYLNITIVGSGEVLKNPDQAKYNENTYVELTAVPPPYGELTYWVFDHWSGDLTGDENPVTIQMTSHKEITATFIEKPLPRYTLTVNKIGNGSVSINPDQANYIHGSEVVLTANPDTCWIFKQWTGDLSGNDNPETIVMNSNKTITAQFTEHDDPPTLDIIKPKKGYLYINDSEIIRLLLLTIIAGPITIEVNASDDQGIDKVEFYIDGELIGEDEVAPYSYTWDKESLIPRRHKLKVIAYDNNGNNDSAELRFWKLRSNHFFLEHPLLTIGLIGGAGGTALLLSRLRSGRDNETETEDDKPTVDTGGPYTGTINIPIQFDGSRSRGKDGGSLTFEWDFGDGSNAVGEKPTHTYTEPGTYQITLRVIDDQGREDSKTTTVTVTDPDADKDMGDDDGDGDEEDLLFWALVTAFSVLMTIALLGAFIKGGKFYV